MKTVKFLMDFQGRETRERFYRKGEVVELEDGVAEIVVQDGRAVFVLPNITVNNGMPSATDTATIVNDDVQMTPTEPEALPEIDPEPFRSTPRRTKRSKS